VTIFNLSNISVYLPDMNKVVDLTFEITFLQQELFVHSLCPWSFLSVSTHG